MSESRGIDYNHGIRRKNRPFWQSCWGRALWPTIATAEPDGRAQGSIGSRSSPISFIFFFLLPGYGQSSYGGYGGSSGYHKREAEASYGNDNYGYGGYNSYPLADSYPAGAHGLEYHYGGAVTPKETPSVQAAKAAHYQAIQAAGGYGNGGYGNQGW
jgi:hypothetical protein